MERRKKTTLSGYFTAVSLIMILIINLILTLLFFNYLRIVVSELTEFSAKENIEHSKEKIITGLKEHECILENTAAAIAYFYRQNILSGNFLINYFNDAIKTRTDSLDIYFTNNRVWNQSGGFAAFGSGWIPDVEWDNTSRPWFIDAKNAGGKAAFSEPYVDSDTGGVIVTLSMTVFDGIEDIGVIANDVTVNNLVEITNSMRNYDRQEIFILNRDGLFITHEDINAVMRNDFFTEKNLEKYRSSVLGGSDTFRIDRNIFIYSSVIPHTDWILVSVIPASVIFARVNSFLIRLILFSMLMFACVAIVSIMFLRRKLTIPLNEVIKVAGALAANDVSVEIRDFKNDEIGDIQKSLIKIRDSLKLNIDSLNVHLKKDNN